MRKKVAPSEVRPRRLRTTEQYGLGQQFDVLGGEDLRDVRFECADLVDREDPAPAGLIRPTEGLDGRLRPPGPNPRNFRDQRPWW
jgi:hypothetical protein